MTYFLKC